MASIQYSIPSSRDRADAIYTNAMARMYGLVALGIVVTTGAAIWVGDAARVGDVIFSLGWIGMLLFFGIIFGTLYAANAVVQRGNIALGIVLYLAFATLWGLFLSPILTRYTSETIGVAFLLTAGLFVAMTIVGMTTKKDLTRLGPMLMIGLIGVIVVSLVNVLLIRSERPVPADQHRPAAAVPRCAQRSRSGRRSR